MNARIRYGNEVDIIYALQQLEGREIATSLEALVPLGRTILSFSMRVHNLPDTEQFADVMNDLGISYADEPRPDEPEPFRLMRFVEVTAPLPMERDRLMKLADKMTILASREGELGNNGVYFIDHTENPLGNVVAELN